MCVNTLNCSFVPETGILLHSHEGPLSYKRAEAEERLGPFLLLHLQTPDSEVSTRVDWLPQ